MTAPIRTAGVGGGARRPPPRAQGNVPRPRRKPRSPQKSKVRNLILAILFFILGIIGVLLPIVPQVPFFIMSVIFFSLVFPRVRRALRRFLRSHPKIAHAYKKWRDKARAKRRDLIRREREWLNGR
jgi:hypothetical protein